MTKRLHWLFKKTFLKTNRIMHRTLSGSDGTGGFYHNYILPKEEAFLRWHDYYFGQKVFTNLKNLFDTAIRENISKELQPEERQRLEKDMLQCLLDLEMTPLEYFLFDFPNLSYSERITYLSDMERWRVLHKIFGEKVRSDHSDKWRFYQLAKPFFHRDACKVGPGASKEDFLDFCSRHPRFFVKELTGCFGRNTYMLEPKNKDDMEKIYQKLYDNGSWMIEEPIIQSKEMSSWNASSVNTVRVASFLTREGVHHNIMPFFRAGRKGFIVDNGFRGGIGAGIDVNTGRVCTEGFDEHGHHFEEHPDSGVHYMGWQMPDWDELLRLTEEMHRSLPSYHRYVAFDLAHTSQGWVLVEGNWGQMLYNQRGARKGARKEFLEYIR